MDERDPWKDLLEQGGPKEEEKGDFFLARMNPTEKAVGVILFNVGPDDHMAKYLSFLFSDKQL